jgi:hypothetical protein
MYSAAMDILVRIPDDLAQRLGTQGEVERRALEALALEEYRLGHLTEPELQRLLGGAAGLPAIDEERRVRANAAAASIIARRKGVTLGGLSLKDLIDEGRP